jgi:hypothetical protein
MDWRHMAELLAAGEQVFAELKNLCVWNKANGGMGTFYRSKHELVFVFKVGSAPHLNTFGPPMPATAAKSAGPPGLFDHRRPPALQPRAYHRTHQTHATTTASQMMKAWIMTPPAPHFARNAVRMDAMKTLTLR